MAANGHLILLTNSVLMTIRFFSSNHLERMISAELSELYELIESPEFDKGNWVCK